MPLGFSTITAEEGTFGVCYRTRAGINPEAGVRIRGTRLLSVPELINQHSRHRLTVIFLLTAVNPLLGWTCTRLHTAQSNSLRNPCQLAFVVQYFISSMMTLFPPWHSNKAPHLSSETRTDRTQTSCPSCAHQQDLTIRNL